MLSVALILSIAGTLIALLIAVLIYAVGVYLLHAPQPWVGVVALIVFVLLLLGNVGTGVGVGS